MKKNNLLNPIRRLKDALPFILDAKVGIISGISEHAIEADSPNFFRYNGIAANTEAFGEYKNFAVGGGAATSREIALAKTIGECIERYSAAIYDKSEFPLFSYKNAPFPCVHPNEFALFSDEQYIHPQFTFDKFDENAPVRWVPATELGSLNEIYVPASMVYVPYFFYQNGDETPIIQPISTGLSCHCSYEEAAIGGICEVIERDNFMITWQAGLSRTKIRHESLSEVNKDLINRFEKVGYEVHLMNISNETQIPGILAVLKHTDTAYVPIVVAASVSLSPEEAVRKALEELAHTERYAYQIRTELPRLEVIEDFDNVLGQVHHVNYWMDEKIVHHASFLYASETYMNFQDLPDFEQATPQEDLTKITTIIRESGYQILISDITTEDVKSLGMFVIRAIIPGYHPLFMGYHRRPLGGKRLWTIPQKLGFKGIVAEGRDTPFPHPFP
jgi:ribosomal protein S12 methylthiotransferase accessory factor